MSARIAAILRAAGHDVLEARQMRLERAKDDELLLRAGEENRILITHDANGFELLHDAWRRWSNAWGVAAAHSGILILAQRPHLAEFEIGEAAARFFEATVPLTNELFRWRPASGWTRRP